MQPLKTYDYLACARQRMLDWTRPLSPEQYTREFPVGMRTLARTLTHIMASEWYYVRRMQGLEVPEYAQWPIRDENPPPFAVLEPAWIQQAEVTRAALAGVRNWEAELEYRIVNDSGKPEIITASSEDIFTQLVLHEVHHRAQAMSMLRQLGIAAEDIDYNTLTYKRRPAPA